MCVRRQSWCILTASVREKERYAAPTPGKDKTKQARPALRPCWTTDQKNATLRFKSTWSTHGGTRRELCHQVVVLLLHMFLSCRRLRWIRLGNCIPHPCMVRLFGGLVLSRLRFLCEVLRSLEPQEFTHFSALGFSDNTALLTSTRQTWLRTRFPPSCLLHLRSSILHSPPRRLRAQVQHIVLALDALSICLI